MFIFHPGVLVAQTRFQLKDASFWSDDSHWEAVVVAANGANDTEGQVIGKVKQNISSFDSKWFLGAADAAMSAVKYSGFYNSLTRKLLHWHP